MEVSQGGIRSKHVAARGSLQQGQYSSSLAVVNQPRPSSDIATLRVFTKALRGRTEYEQYCCCFYCPQPSPPFSSSALLIGRNDSNDQNHHVTSLKEHLTQLNVSIFKCESDFRGSRDALNDLISEFLSKRYVSLFVLYYSGPTNDSGNWAFTTTSYEEEYTEYIRLETITNRWKKEAHTSSQLLIIVDGDNASKWVEKVQKYESNSNISVMALQKLQFTKDYL